jgi:hypothetical protein
MAIPLRAVGFVAWHLTAFAASLPLLVACLVPAAKYGFSWRICVLLVLAVLATWAINTPMAVSRFWFGDVDRFLDAFKRCSFSPISLNDYLSMVRRFYPRHDALSDRDLAVRVMPWLSRTLPKRLRIVVASSLGNDTEAHHPAHAVTFATIGHAWVVLPIPPHALTELQYFILLHEIGHTCWGCGGPNERPPRDWRLLGLWALPFLAAVMIPGTPMLWVIAILGLLLCALTTLENMRETLLDGRVEAEVRADLYALDRCDATWCARYTEEQLARVLCRPDRGQVTDGVKLLRERAFIDNLRRRREGRPLTLPSELLAYPVVSGLAQAAAFALPVACGFAISPPTWLRLALVTGITAALGFVALVIVLADRMLAELVDGAFNVATPSENALRCWERARSIGQRIRARSLRPSISR